MTTVAVPGHVFTDVELLCLDLDRTLFDHESAAESGVAALLAATPWASELPTEVSADPMPRWRALESLHYTRYERREIDHDEQRRERLRDFLHHRRWQQADHRPRSGRSAVRALPGQLPVPLEAVR